MSDTITRKTAQQIVEAIRDVCEQHINFINEQGIITASTDHSRIGQFHEIGQRVIQSGSTIEVTEDDSFSGSKCGVNIPISHNRSTIGAIGITGHPDEIRKYAYLAQKVTHLLLQERDLELQANSRKNKINYIIRTLLYRESFHQDMLSDLISEFHVNACEAFYTVLVQINPRYNPDNLFLIEKSIYEVFDSCSCTFYTFQYPNQYLAIVREPEFTQKKYLFRNLADRHHGVLEIGVGCLQPLFQQAISLRHAAIAVQSLNKGQTFALFDELDLALLLGSVPNEVILLFQNKVLASLSKEDLVLLRTYYEEDMSLKQVGERLFLHKNTIQYQLDRITERCGYNPRKFRDAAVLYCALKTLP